MSYGGNIPRQSLVDFAQEQARRIQRDRDNLGDAEHIARRNGDEAKAREFERVDWLRQGEQIALRNVCEWAKTVAEQGQEGLKNQYDGLPDEGEGVLQRNIVGRS
jgi:hypothetical protein